jgi:hypothetical protein
VAVRSTLRRACVVVVLASDVLTTLPEHAETPTAKSAVVPALSRVSKRPDIFSYSRLVALAGQASLS